MKTKQCNKCGGTFPATTEHFYKNGKGKDGSVRLQTQCKKCMNARRLADYSTPEGKAKVKKKNDKFRKENPDYHKDYSKERYARPEVKAKKKAYYEQNKEKINARGSARYKAQRLEEGKEIGVKTPPTNFYIGYVVLESGTYFKAGITSYDSMEDRYKKDCKMRGKLIGVQQTDFWRFDSEDEARAMEREFLSHCQIFLGEPAMGREWFNVR